MSRNIVCFSSQSQERERLFYKPTVFLSRSPLPFAVSTLLKTPTPIFPIAFVFSTGSGG
jgi:hypothetical protein